ncbi:MAG: insulinase family protein [Gemmatimonadaceae bacterium]|nr:insulinase family protein [Gemmatimonadaceae bacterium]
MFSIMRRAAFRTLAGTTLFGLTAPLAAQTFRAPTTETYTLDNGLRVILAEDHAAQVVTVNVWYDVGARNERPGRTGFAHLFEHMMFQGSAHVAKGDHLSLVQRSGGTLNASTAEDRTNYFQSLPSNRVNLGLWLEAERMRSLRVTKEHFENQRETVKEERRLRIDNQPYMGAYYSAIAGVFDPARCFAYAHETIGSMDDLNAAALDDVIDFHRTYYRPNNATLVVTGDFEPAQIKRLITQYFADIPRGPAPPPVSCDQPFHSGQQRRNITDAKASLPAVLILWRLPGYAHADWPALNLLSVMMGQGASSRLNRAVVRDARAAVATQAFAGIGAPRRGPNIFGTLAVANQGVAADSLETMLQREVERVRTSGVLADELEKAKNAHRAAQFAQLETSMGRAEALHVAQLFLGDAKALQRDVDRYSAVTLADIQRVAATWLTSANSTIVTITPETRRP